MSRKRKTILVVGAGTWGRTWLPLIERSPDWELLGVVDPKKSSQRALPEGLQVYSALEKALQVRSPDGILLATPHTIRLSPIREALKSGVSILVEKPLTASVEEARRIARLARRYPKARIMVSQNYRFMDVSGILQKHLAQRLLGPVGTVHIRYFMNIMQHLDLRGTYRDRTAYNMVLEMSIHHFDLLRWLTGQEVRSVYARAFQVPWQKMKNDYAIHGILELADGTSVEYSGNWAAPDSLSGWYGDWQIGCSKGFYLCDGLTLKKRAGGKTEQILKERVGTSAARRRVLEEFADALERRREPRCSLWDNLNSLAICFAVIASAEKGRPVQVKDILKKMGS